MSGWHGGKGSDPRPLSVSPDDFDKNHNGIDWDARAREARGCTGAFQWITGSDMPRPKAQVVGCTCGECRVYYPDGDVSEAP